MQRTLKKFKQRINICGMTSKTRWSDWYLPEDEIEKEKEPAFIDKKGKWQKFKKGVRMLSVHYTYCHWYMIWLSGIL